MKKVFFYGLFMDPGLLKNMGYKPKNMQQVFITDYQLVIGEKASLLPKSGAKAYGTIMELQTDELARLYAGEGVQEYIPQMVQVSTMTGEMHNALCYILPKDKVSGSNSDYAKNLALVAINLSLPGGYIDEIKTWVKT